MSNFQEESNLLWSNNEKQRAYAELVIQMQDSFYGIDHMDKLCLEYSLCRSIIRETNMMIYDIQAQNHINNIKQEYEIRILEEKLQSLRYTTKRGN